VVEDQVTYPLTTAMLSVPKSKVVRGFSFFGASFVYIIFEDGTDIYWARSRVLEYLNFASGRMPKGDTADRAGRHRRRLGVSVRAAGQGQDPRRTAHDPGLVSALPARQGPRRGRSRFDRRLRADLPGHRRSGEAARLRHSADEDRPGDPRLQPGCGGRVVEMAETEYMVRGKGYLRGKDDIERWWSRPTRARRC
jgi:Cu(I)/Ag(I) efflux system membrane protein CusA/SilA